MLFLNYYDGRKGRTFHKKICLYRRKFKEQISKERFFRKKNTVKLEIIINIFNWNFFQENIYSLLKSR